MSLARIFQPAPDPKTELGRHRILSPTAGLRVSPLCLGAMNFGDSSKDYLGECNKDTSFAIMDCFYEHGGNFIDTANMYQDEESEEWIGEWMEKRGNREEMVIATKFTSPYKISKLSDKQIGSNYYGNATKHLRTSLEGSLQKLRTDYIDLMYVHWWDFTTGVEELMQSLNHFVASGKILYLGISDTPAWIVAKANDYARQHGLRPFSVYQGHWSVSQRDMEQEVVDMAYDYGMALAPWGALGRGQYKTEEQRKADEGQGRNMGGPSEADLKVNKVLEKVAKAHGTMMTSVAIAWIMQSAPHVYPIVGGRKVEHLKSNIEALSLVLSDEEMHELNTAYGFSYIFPKSFLFRGEPPSANLDARNVLLTKSAVQLVGPNKIQAYRPKQK